MFLQCLRQFDVSGKFVEFFGPGVSSLSILERTAIANMCPEYGASLAFFPMDSACLDYLQCSGFSARMFIFCPVVTSVSLAQHITLSVSRHASAL